MTMKTFYAVLVLLLAVQMADSFTHKCNQPEDKGHCDGNQKRYFYDQKRNKCESFMYSGCGGNSNQFTHLIFCARACVKK